MGEDDKEVGIMQGISFQERQNREIESNNEFLSILRKEYPTLTISEVNNEFFIEIPYVVVRMEND